MGTVYVVHCIDTEGPLYESGNVVFEQIKRIFGLDIENTQENYELLQRGTLDCGEHTAGIRELLRNHQAATKGSWNEIDQMLKKITSEEFRKKLRDSKGEGWIYSWFCMDHVGFFGENPRRRDVGHHKVFDRYYSMAQEQDRGDLIAFHHHPVPFSGNYHDSGTTYWGKDTLNEILTRKIIERNWFPDAFRPGFHTERPDSHWFLEQWIPFDYGNQATDNQESGQLDIDRGRFGDWRHAPKEWFPYHPSHDDYQAKGNCRRWITRCLNMKARIRELQQEDVDAAFRAAEEGKDTILAFTDHDYKDMESEIDKVREMICLAAGRFPDAKFKYANAVDAMRSVLKLQREEMQLEMSVDRDKFPVCLHVTAQKDIFGPQPFLAIKMKEGRYLWDDFDFVEKNEWSYTFDSNTVSIDEVETIGVASNNSYGMTEILRYDCKQGVCSKKIINA